MNIVAPVLVLSLVGLVLGYRAYQIAPIRRYLRSLGVNHPHDRHCAIELTSVIAFDQAAIRAVLSESLELAEKLSPSSRQSVLARTIEVKQRSLSCFAWRYGHGPWGSFEVRPVGGTCKIVVKGGVNWKELIILAIFGAVSGPLGKACFVIALVLFRFDYDCGPHLIGTVVRLKCAKPMSQGEYQSQCEGSRSSKRVDNCV